MSRNYQVLAGAIAVAALLGGVAKVVDRRPSGPERLSAAPGPTQAAASTVAPAATAAGPSSSVTDFVDGDRPTTVPVITLPIVPATCGITEVLEPGSEGQQVECLQTMLTANGYQLSGGVFDGATDQAVRAYQTAKDLDVDGVVGRQTAQALGIWQGGDDPLPARDSQCPDTDRAVLVDRANQVGWFCADGKLTEEFPITSAWSQPDPGTYAVYAKDLNASSNLTGQYSTMTHFVAFTKGKYKGARIAFHSVPKYANGEYVQPLDSVGTEALHGASSGCIRVLPDDAVKIWDYLDIGDTVRVIS
jgi:hypothetical protein